MRCEECLALSEEEFEGGLSEQNRAAVASHLSSCASCAAEHRALVREQAVYSRFLLGVEPSPGLWENVRAGIERQRAEGAPSGTGAHTAGGAYRLRELFAGLFAAPRRAALVYAALVVVMLSALFVVWRGQTDERTTVADAGTGGQVGVAPAGGTLPAPGPPAPATPQPPAFVPTPQVRPAENFTPAALKRGGAAATRMSRAGSAAPRVAAESESFREWLRGLEGEGAPAAGSAVSLGAVATVAGSPDFEAARHTERVQITLSSFLNSRARRGAADVAYERRQSQELLLRNVLLRQAAQGEGDLQREELLQRVEPILLEIANLPAKASPDDVRQIQGQMRKREIVSALRLYSTQASGQAF
jgi:hypothetical protein